MTHHNHEWITPLDDSTYIYEDGALHITERCEYIEQRSAGHSERLDETFYETMYKCEAERCHRFDVTGIEHVYYRDDEGEGCLTLSQDAEAIFEMEDAPQGLREEIELAARERLCDDSDSPPEVFDWFYHEHVDTGPHHIEVEVRGEQYYLTYEQTEVKRL
jgi:hypothetical protein